MQVLESKAGLQNGLRIERRRRVKVVKHVLIDFRQESFWSRHFAFSRLEFSSCFLSRNAGGYPCMFTACFSSIRLSTSAIVLFVLFFSSVSGLSEMGAINSSVVVEQQ